MLSYDDLPWAETLSVQAQLKRMADLLVAAVAACNRAVCAVGDAVDLARRPRAFALCPET